MQYKINEQLVNAVLNYLATRPYVEVFQLVEALKKVEKIEEKVEEVEEVKE
jgi:hypothetical protein